MLLILPPWAPPATPAALAAGYLTACLALASLLVPVLEEEPGGHAAAFPRRGRCATPGLSFAAALGLLVPLLGIPAGHALLAVGLLGLHLAVLRALDSVLRGAGCGLGARTLLLPLVAATAMLAPILGGGMLEGMATEAARERLTSFLLLLHPAPAALGSVAGIDWLRGEELYRIGTLVRFYPFRYPSAAAAALANAVAWLVLTCGGILISRWHRAVGSGP